MNAHLIRCTMPVADAGPGPLIVPIGGSVIVAGIFLTLAVITGGLWLVRWWQHPSSAAGARTTCLVSLGAASCSAAVLPGFLGFVYPAAWAVALLLLAGGVFLIRAGLRLRANHSTESTDREERFHSSTSE